LNIHTFWKLLLVSSILIGAFGLFALGNFDTNISGDGIPNKPQSARAWDQAVQIITVVTLSAIAAIYSGIKIFR
jgi:amino acid permease